MFAPQYPGQTPPINPSAPAPAGRIDLGVGGLSLGPLGMMGLGILNAAGQGANFAQAIGGGASAGIANSLQAQNQILNANKAREELDAIRAQKKRNERARGIPLEDLVEMSNGDRAKALRLKFALDYGSPSDVAEAAASDVFPGQTTWSTSQNYVRAKVDGPWGPAGTLLPMRLGNNGQTIINTGPAGGDVKWNPHQFDMVPVAPSYQQIGPYGAVADVNQGTVKPATWQQPGLTPEEMNAPAPAWGSADHFRSTVEAGKVQQVPYEQARAVALNPQQQAIVDEVYGVTSQTPPEAPQAVAPVTQGQGTPAPSSGPTGVPVAPQTGYGTEPVLPPSGGFQSPPAGGPVMDPTLDPVYGAQKKVQEKLATEAVDRKINAPSTIRKLERMLDSTLKLVTHENFNDAFGYESVFPTWPGSKTADAEALLDQIRGGTFLAGFQDLKGGGPITEIEGLKAEQSIARLKQSQSDEGARAALADLVESTVNIIRDQQNFAGVPPEQWMQMPDLEAIRNGTFKMNMKPLDPEDPLGVFQQ